LNITNIRKYLDEVCCIGCSRCKLVNAGVSCDPANEDKMAAKAENDIFHVFLFEYTRDKMNIGLPFTQSCLRRCQGKLVQIFRSSVRANILKNER